MLTNALMIAPRASMEQMLLIISMREIRLTPIFAQKNTNALVTMDLSDALDAILIAVTRSYPLFSSSRNRVVSRIA